MRTHAHIHVHTHTQDQQGEILTRAEFLFLSQLFSAHQFHAVWSLSRWSPSFLLMNFTVMRIFKGSLWGFKYVL